MSRLLWLVAGFCGGVAMSRNAAPMPTPVVATVFVVGLLGCVVTWWAGYRGKSVAVATAVASARAEAAAEAAAAAEAHASVVAQLEARAAALAQVVVNLPGSGAVPASEPEAARAGHALPAGASAEPVEDTFTPWLGPSAEQARAELPRWES
jgi:hypothetical protein